MTMFILIVMCVLFVLWASNLEARIMKLEKTTTLFSPTQMIFGPCVSIAGEE